MDANLQESVLAPVRWEVGGVGDFVLPAGTVTLLLLDVEGSTRMWEREPSAAADAISALHELLDETVGRYAGVRPVEQGEGDSAVAAFSRASDAIACALDLQAASGLRVRIGLHTGEVQLRGTGNYVGSVVNRCARVRDLGHGGQTLLSRATADLVVDKLPEGVSLRDLGEHRLRDLARPEHVFQLGDGEFPPLRTLDATPNNLPSQLTTFIGREHDVEQVVKLIGDARLLTLTGAGGCGKTRLALQAAADVAERHPDGVWFVDLAPLTDESNVAPTVAAALGVKEVPGRDWLPTLTEWLEPRRALVLLDNCEHVVAASAALAVVVLRACPSVTVLTTSRETLAVEGEVTWRVPNLSVPREAPGADAGRALASYDAVALFIERAKRVRPNFSVTDEIAPAVAQICQRLDGIPLAIELAAARVRVLSPQQIAAGLDDRFKMLGAGPRTAVPRHQTLRASIAWSYELLTEAERVLLRRLSAFAGGFDLDAAEDVCADDETDRWRVLEHLTALVERSLVDADDEGGVARYRMLETIRQYATELLVASGEQDELRTRHLRRYAAYAARIEPLLAVDQPPALALLDREVDNFRAALEWALQAGPAHGANLCSDLQIWWYVRGRYAEWARWTDAYAARSDLSQTARGNILTCRSFAYTCLLDVESALVSAQQSLEIARTTGDRRLAGRALHLVGGITRFGDDHAAAEPMLDEALTLTREAHDVFFMLEALQYKSLGASGSGDALRAAEAAREGLEASRRVNDPDHAATFVTLLGFAALLEGRFADVASCAAESYPVAAESGNRIWEGFSLQIDGWAALYTGDRERALRTFEQCVALFPDHPLGASYEGLVAIVRIAQGDAGAAAALQTSLDAWLATGISLLVQDLLMTLAETRGSGPMWQDALHRARHFDSPYFEGRALAGLGRLGRAEGEDARADDLLHDALRLHVQTGDRPSVADTLESLAGIAATQESLAEAARLFGAAQALRDDMGYVRFAAAQRRYEADVALLGPAFGDAWAAGAALAPDEAVSYAQRGRGERGRPSSGWASLTPAELSVVKLVGDGLTNAQIAEKLFIASGTVKTHLGHVFAKLGMSGRAELAAEATRRGV